MTDRSALRAQVTAGRVMTSRTFFIASRRRATRARVRHVMRIGSHGFAYSPKLLEGQRGLLDRVRVETHGRGPARVVSLAWRHGVMVRRWSPHASVPEVGRLLALGPFGKMGPKSLVD